MARLRSGEAAWRGFSALAAGLAAALALATLALAALVDPYDTGRSPLSGTPGLRPQGPRTAAASRGRDPAFDAAIVGNSHAQLLSPERLDAATGLRLVQLSVPATGPREQLLLADWFLRHHPAARALVLAPDPAWCTDDPALAPTTPFPEWLYARAPLAYLAGLMRLSAVGEAGSRLAEGLRRAPPRARADGYFDYAPEIGGPDPDDPARAAARNAPTPDAADPRRAGPFPAAARLRDAVSALPPGLALVVLFPPVYAPTLPRPGTPRAAAETACKAALTEAAAAHPRTTVLDWRQPRPGLDDPHGFLDAGHYRHPVARAVEADIAAALGRLRTGS